MSSPGGQPKERTIDIIGVPIDLGAGRRGVDMGPSAIRIAGLQEGLEALGHTVRDLGDLEVRNPETEEIGDGSLCFKAPIFAVCEELLNQVDDSLRRACFPLVLGGDHSLAIGSIAGTACHFANRDEIVGLIWLDAHGDFNTPVTTPSGNIHGMPLAVALGLGDPDLVHLGDLKPKISPEHSVLIGARDLDRLERQNLNASGMTVFTMRELDEQGMPQVIKEAIAIASRDTAGIHVSLDLDVIDPEHAPGTGTPVIGGMTYREAHLAMETMADRAAVVALDVVEVNPVLDTRNHTAGLAAELIQSLLGKRIL